ncbi:uncharacterized protein LOC581852 [Strongylocentrotus purpuratus]|uniref:Mis18 domain-containing protein n=1 Tax=Strongylocentrotus purpuratus TaxID=7668 RepID=A0A7M7HGA6_STRPU|nr:uncharacterized protein LOC581852 [Strongylocentrotus purpuratus]|eukprot:XP_011666415.1 PREDICTED: uncharacterized protein LOC581852 [Strongylocentrotus purpuratus]
MNTICETQNMETAEIPESDCPDKDLPAVFQCQRCNVIISDSIAFTAAHDDLKSITVNRVNSSVELSTKLITSTDGIDQGSTFSPLVCQGCKTVLGKVYRTTPRPLDDLRDYFTFDVNKLSVYQVGSSDSSALPESESSFQQYTNLKTLKETTLKLQVLMCAMHQRILNIEQSLEIEDTNVAENPLQSMAGLLGPVNPSGSSSTADHQPKEVLKGGAAKGQSLALQLKGGKDSAVLPGIRNGPEMGQYPMKDVQRSDAFERASGSETSGATTSNFKGTKRSRGSSSKASRGRSSRGKASGSHPTSSDSDSETSGATMSNSKRGRGSSTKTPRGRSRGGKGQENASNLNQVRGTKRTNDFGEVPGDQDELEHGLELLSPIRKKSSVRRNKPL